MMTFAAVAERHLRHMLRDLEPISVHVSPVVLGQWGVEVRARGGMPLISRTVAATQPDELCDRIADLDGARLVQFASWRVEARSATLLQSYLDTPASHVPRRA